MYLIISNLYTQSNIYKAKAKKIVKFCPTLIKTAEHIKIKYSYINININ